MAIVFRCPQCAHKVRGPDDGAGKQAWCKCGALISIPAPQPIHQLAEAGDEHAWALKPNSADEAFEPSSAWSPLFADVKRREQGVLPDTATRWRFVLIGTASFLALVLVIGIAAAVRQSFRTETPVSPAPSTQLTENPSPPSQPASQAEPVSTPLPPKPPVVAKSEPKAVKAAVTVPSQAPPKLTPELPVARGRALAEAPVRDASLLHVKQPPPEGATRSKGALEKAEILQWHIAAEFAVLENDGSAKVLKLNKEADKLGVVLIAVRARLPARALIGKQFLVLNPDVRLIAPDGMPYYAIGIEVGDKLWFAPTDGQRAYGVDKSVPATAPTTQSWLFIAPLNHLNAGRMLFQFREETPQPLKTAARRK